MNFRNVVVSNFVDILFSSRFALLKRQHSLALLPNSFAARRLFVSFPFFAGFLVLCVSFTCSVVFVLFFFLVSFSMPEWKSTNTHTHTGTEKNVPSYEKEQQAQVLRRRRRTRSATCSICMHNKTRFRINAANYSHIFTNTIDFHYIYVAPSTAPTGRAHFPCTHMIDDHFRWTRCLPFLSSPRCHGIGTEAEVMECPSMGKYSLFFCASRRSRKDCGLSPLDSALQRFRWNMYLLFISVWSSSSPSSSMLFVVDCSVAIHSFEY